jgi:hypothetical protein
MRRKPAAFSYTCGRRERKREGRREKRKGTR